MSVQRVTADAPLRRRCAVAAPTLRDLDAVAATAPAGRSVYVPRSTYVNGDSAHGPCSAFQLATRGRGGNRVRDVRRLHFSCAKKLVSRAGL